MRGIVLFLACLACVGWCATTLEPSGAGSPASGSEEIFFDSNAGHPGTPGSEPLDDDLAREDSLHTVESRNPASEPLDEPTPEHSDLLGLNSAVEEPSVTSGLRVGIQNDSAVAQTTAHSDLLGLNFAVEEPSVTSNSRDQRQNDGAVAQERASTIKVPSVILEHSEESGNDILRPSAGETDSETRGNGAVQKSGSAMDRLSQTLEGMRPDFRSQNLRATARLRQGPERKAQHTLADALSQQFVNIDTHRVGMLLTILAFGTLRQVRFPNKDAELVQRILLQFLVPVTLLKGLSKEMIGEQHAVYLKAGALLVLARLVSSALASYAILAPSSSSGSSINRRTATFQISSMASSLSVLPFLNEFSSAQYVGLGSIVDLPMKVYMLLIMPCLVRMCGARSTGGSPSSGKRIGILSQLLVDPITLSMILGIALAHATNGAGIGSLGFVGEAIDALESVQTPVLVFLIGLKLNFDGSTTLICVVVLLATQGLLLIAVSVTLPLLQPSAEIARFIIFFSQGAPSVVGFAVISNAVNSGYGGYSTDFAFDLFSLAFPISSFMQCCAGAMGERYTDHVGVVGAVLVFVALSLRILFSKSFQCGSAPMSRPQPDVESNGVAKVPEPDNVVDSQIELQPTSVVSVEGTSNGHRGSSTSAAPRA